MDGACGGQPSAERTEVLSSNENNAVRLKESTYALFTWATMRSDLKGIDVEAYQLYRDQMLSGAGNPSDPVERMILEQLILAHLNVGLLQYKATNAGTIQATAAYASASARLIAEFRRSALALQAYRLSSRQLANDPSKDIVMPAEQAETCEGLPGKDDAEDEKGATREASDGGETIIPYPGHPSRGDQSVESPEVARGHTRRQGKASRRDPVDQALGDDHRAANA
jgi:hypothetical protein